MLFLNRKKILTLLILILICLILMLTLVKIKKDNDSEIQLTVALPVNGKTIIIDAGHGGEDRRGCSRRPEHWKQI